MTPEEQLIEAVREGQHENALGLLKEGADIRHAEDAALRLAVGAGDDRMREVLLWRYPDDASRQEAGDAIADELARKAEALRQRPKEIKALKMIRDLTPDIEI